MENTFEIINEYQLTEAEREQIRHLFGECFTSYPEGRTHFKQVPSFRLVARRKDTFLAHVAVTYRWMSLDQTTIKVFGLTDVCVAPEARTQKLATKMIARLETLGKEQEVDFLVLIAWDPQIYQSMGFEQVNNRCRWLLIHNDQSLGLAQRRIEEGLMIKSIGDRSWQEGMLDFLGPVF